MTHTGEDSKDPVIAALDALSEVVDETAAEGRRPKAEIRRVRAAAQDARYAREALSGRATPRLVGMLNTMLARLSTASGALRRAIVRGLPTTDLGGGALTSALRWCEGWSVGMTPRGRSRASTIVSLKG